MKTKQKHNGLTLTETTIVVAIVAMMAFFGLPAIKTFFNSIGTPGGVKSMINASLSSARAIAAREQKYAGIRFQKDTDDNQYMIFIVHDPDPTVSVNRFTAVKNVKPVKLPENLAVMVYNVPSGTSATDINDTAFNFSAEPQWDTDATTFSIIFSPSGKLTLHEVKAMPAIAADQIFNNLVTVNAGNANFYQDDGVIPGIDAEQSYTSFIVYEKKELEKAETTGQPYDNYLQNLKLNFINAYTGSIIKTD